MAFDYEINQTDDEAVRRVAGEMTGAPLAPLSPEDIALREMERETQRELYRQQDEQIRRDNLLEEAAKQEAAQHEQAMAAAEARDKAQRERARDIDRQVTARSLSDLRMAAARADTFQRDVRTSHANAVRQQNISNILSEINAMANPPLSPEPTVVVVEADPDDNKFCGVEKIYGPNPRRSWW
jgi:hypothetical protein